MRAIYLIFLPTVATSCAITLAPCGDFANQSFAFEGGMFRSDCGEADLQLWACVGSDPGMYDVELDMRFCRANAGGTWDALHFNDSYFTYQNSLSKACLVGTLISETAGALSQMPCRDGENSQLWSKASGASIKLAYSQLCLTMVHSVDASELWHPYYLMYLLQVVVHVIVTIMSLRCPKALLIITLFSGAVYPISFIAGLKTWTYEPGGFMWLSLFFKWIIVDFMATLPVLYIKAFNASDAQIRMVGYFVYGVLGLNVITTLLLSKSYIMMNINNGTAVMLTISLIFRCRAVSNEGHELFKIEDRSGGLNGRFLYGFGTPFWWLVCYSVWNALFIASYTIGGTLQVILFWLMMFYYWCQDNPRHRIEFYFAYARPVELGTFVGLSEWCGTLIPFFKYSSNLDLQQPMPINSHAYFLFITSMNFLFAIVVLVWAFQEWAWGIKYFDKDLQSLKIRAHDQNSATVELIDPS